MCYKAGGPVHFKVLDLLDNMQKLAQRMSVFLQTMYLAIFFKFNGGSCQEPV